jgi:hypothetical protein
MTKEIPVRYIQTLIQEYKKTSETETLKVLEEIWDRCSHDTDGWIKINQLVEDNCDKINLVSLIEYRNECFPDVPFIIFTDDK